MPEPEVLHPPFVRRNSALQASREPETGRGPVDFKFSRGMSGRVVVEAKLSTNNRLVHAFDKQAQIYQEAEGAAQAVIVVFVVSEAQKQLDRLIEHANANQIPGKTPEIVLIDALPRPSASVA